jgi:DNA-binding CsgD family transcriptional regulator
LRQEALELAREAKLLERAAKLAVQEKLDESIRQLALRGLSKAAIARELHCSGSRVSAALRRVEASAPNANEESRNGRLRRGRQALAYQRDGLSRREIAQVLDCSFETVKSILKDAKFFEDPATDPHRLQRAVAVDAARDLVRVSDAAAKLGWEIKEVKAARSDATVLGRMDKWT